MYLKIPTLCRHLLCCLIGLNAGHALAQHDLSLRTPDAKVVASDSASLLPSVIEIDGVRMDSVISNGKIVGFKAHDELIRVTYLRLPGGGGLVSHLVLQNERGNPIALAPIPQALADPAYASLLVEDTRSLEAIEAEMKTLREGQTSALRLKLNRELALKGESSQSDRIPDVSQRKSITTCKLVCDYAQKIDENRCDQGWNTGTALCDPLLALGPGGIALRISCIANLASALNNCRNAAASKWLNCHFECDRSQGTTMTPN